MTSMSSVPNDGDRIIVRLASFSDIPKLAFTAFTGYAGSPLEQFLSPLRLKYPEDALRSWYHRMVFRFLDPRMISVVACPASAPDKVLGYAQFFRIGDDAGAKRQISSRRTAWLLVSLWYYSVKFKIVECFRPDRSVNVTAEKQFNDWCRIDDEAHWNSVPERKNRWHLRSIVVMPEWRGKGVGTLLLKELLDRAQNEATIVGLEASADGEHLYRKLGFELLSRFYYEKANPMALPNEGGVMMWRPGKIKDS